MSEDLIFPRAAARAYRPPPSLHPRCDRCGLYKGGCRSPRMPVWGRGRAGLLVVSDYPGKDEDAAGHAFAGGAGRHLARLLAESGLDLEGDCWSTNAQICYDVKKAQPKTANEDCRPNLLRAVAELKPVAILLAGGLAVASYLGAVWKPDPGPLNRWAGRRIPLQSPNAWVVCTHNPAFVLRPKTDAPTRRGFEADVAAAAELARAGRPWPAGPPDYKKLVRCVTDPAEAAAALAKIRAGLVAFDFETTARKADGPHAELHTCAVCHEGRTTVAFPWHPAVVPEMRRLVTDPAIGTIGSNLWGMEARWCARRLGVELSNGAWDTMLTAHCSDPRPSGKTKEDGTALGSGTTGLKYQAFVRLGQPEYNSHLEDHLRSETGNDANRIRELPLQTVLLYNGLDALLEYLVAEDQAEELGVPIWPERGTSGPRTPSPAAGRSSGPTGAG